MNFKTYALFLSLVVSVIATIGSLFFSEVMEFTPCSLCWYQRVLMYPECVLFLIAFIRNDFKVFIYTNTLSVLGFLTALYQNLLIWEWIPETASPCREGIPCSATYIDWFGFISIPLLSLVAFSILIAIGMYSQSKIVNKRTSL